MNRGDSTDLAAPPQLGEGEIHAWVLELGPPGSSPGISAILSADEQGKADRFSRGVDRHRYIASHWALRVLLGGYCGIPPKLLNFRTEFFGKPTLDPESNPTHLSFNMAHSGDLALIAVVCQARIGVDVELWRPEVISPGILTRFCSPREAALINRADGKARLEAFFSCWTGKEAYLKAVGCGLVDEVCSVEMPALAEADINPREIMRALPLQLDRTQHWALYNLTVPEGYSSALVIESGRNFRLREFKTAI